jgi:hypothetical protein
MKSMSIGLETVKGQQNYIKKALEKYIFGIFVAQMTFKIKNVQ